MELENPDLSAKLVKTVPFEGAVPVPRGSDASIQS